MTDDYLQSSPLKKKKINDIQRYKIYFDALLIKFRLFTSPEAKYLWKKEVVLPITTEQGDLL